MVHLAGGKVKPHANAATYGLFGAVFVRNDPSTPSTYTRTHVRASARVSISYLRYVC